MLRDCQLRAGYRRRAMGVSRVGSYVIPREAIADRAQLQRPEHGRVDGHRLARRRDGPMRAPGRRADRRGAARRRGARRARRVARFWVVS